MSPFPGGFLFFRGQAFDEDDPEGGAHFGIALDRDLSPVGFNDSLHVWKTHAQVGARPLG
jgi:hypothetical protein